MSTPVLFVELWGGIVAVVGTGAAVINRRRPHRGDPSSWARMMDAYLDERLLKQHYESRGHICGPGCDRLGVNDNWRKGLL